MGHDHSHVMNTRALLWAILINVFLTIVQVIAGILSGSLSLLADALHNFSDAGSLIVAFIAQKVSGLPPNKGMNFGYGRAQILGALINSITLVFVGLYLIYETWVRFQNPASVNGWMVIWVASAALVIDLATAWLTHSGSKDNINMRAAFIHNLSDAMASIVVIISGVVIINYKIYWVDLVATLLISFYILYQSVGLIKSCIRILMQAVPEDLDHSEIVLELKKITNVNDVHHIHIWTLFDNLRSFEAHIKLSTNDFSDSEEAKKKIRKVLKNQFKISHSTLELEFRSEVCHQDDPNL